MVEDQGYDGSELLHFAVLSKFKKLKYSPSVWIRLVLYKDIDEHWGFALFRLNQDIRLMSGKLAV